MKHYCMCWVNSRTGEIAHMASSDRPLAIDHITPEIPQDMTVEIPGEPPIPPLTYIIHEFEVDIDNDQGLVRARDMMSRVEIINGKAEVVVSQQTKVFITSRKPLRDFKNARV